MEELVLFIYYNQRDIFQSKGRWQSNKETQFCNRTNVVDESKFGNFLFVLFEYLSLIFILYFESGIFRGQSSNLLPFSLLKIKMLTSKLLELITGYFTIVETKYGTYASLLPKKKNFPEHFRADNRKNRNIPERDLSK